MAPLLTLLGQIPGAPVFRTLGWGFLIAAVVWLLIWRLLRPRGGGGADVSSGPEPLAPGALPGPVPSPARDTGVPPEAQADGRAATRPEAAALPAPAPATGPRGGTASGKVIDISRRPRTAPASAPTAEEASGEAVAGEARADGDASDQVPSPLSNGPKREESSGGADRGATPPTEPTAGLDPDPDSRPTPDSQTDSETAPAAAEEPARPGFQPATPDEAAAAFREELESGRVRQDPVYGIVYLTPPGDPDDLKRIKGIARVLESKLNGLGVYQYRQIAVWTAPAVAEFSQLLTSFKDRIIRDDWIAQAKRLHEETRGLR